MIRFRVLKRPKVMVGLVIILLVLAAFVMAFKNLNGPAEGTITTPLMETPGSSIKSGPNKYSDKYVSFDYPSKYQTNASEKDASTLDEVNLIKTTRRDQYAAIAIVRESLASDSGVNYRRLHPELYKAISSDPTTAVFAKQDNTEYTGFIGHSGLVISISFTSVAPADLGDDYKVISDSLQWKQ